MLYAKTITAAILASAVTIGSTATVAAPPMPASAETQSGVLHIQHKKSQKNWNRPQSPQPQRRKNNNEAVAIGVGIAAVLGAIALSQQAQSNDGARSECRRLRWKCREGRGWACRRYDDLCN